jgi:competence protein ComEC
MELFFKQAPFFRFCSAFIVGILLSHFVFSDLPLVILLTFSAVLCMVLFLITYLIKMPYSMRYVYGWVILSLCLLGGMLNMRWHQENYESGSRELLPGIYQNRIMHCIEPLNAERNTYLMHLLPLGHDTIGELKGIVQLPDYLVAHGGERFWGDIHVMPMPERGKPWDFDFAEWMQNKEIHFSAVGLFIAEIPNTKPGVRDFAIRFRSYLLAILQKHLEGNELSLAQALILGVKSDLPDEMRSAYATAGAMHVLAVSGLHVGIIYLILFYLLTPLRNDARKRWLFTVICLTSIWIYALITGLSPSVSRAAIMFSLFSIGQSIIRKSDPYNIVFLAAFILLTINPLQIFSLSFQLSFAAVLGIIICYKPICNLWMPAKKWKAYFYGILVASVAATLFTLPLGLFYFRQFPVYFLLTNIVVVPAAFILLSTGILFLILSHFSWIAALSAKIFSGLLWLCNEYVFLIHDLPFSAIMAGIAAYEVWFLYLIVLCFIWLLNQYHPKVWLASAAVLAMWIGVELFNKHQKIQSPKILSTQPIAASFGHQAALIGVEHPEDDKRITNWLMSEGYAECIFLTPNKAFNGNWYRQDGFGGIQIGDTAWVSLP